MAKPILVTNSETRIDKGVPLPDSGRMKLAWPLRDMEVGDSFSLNKSRVSALRSAIHSEQHVSPGKKFMVRTAPAETRCWRTA
jgi:hypothetical protein